jgi:CRISPR system Cascade subunit CasA
MNLLFDPVFTVSTGGGQRQVALPTVYHLLSSDQVEGFSKLQAHQRQGWHSFLAQLGAIAAEEAGKIPTRESEWRAALDALACEEAWQLETESLKKPAFMQPPVPEDTLEDFDEIHVGKYDVPVLSKNHALKGERMQAPRPEHWAYMLVNVQTMESSWGRGKYPTSRVNGGYAARSFFGLTPSLRLGPWIMRDIEVLHDNVDVIADRYGYEGNVTPLLWTRSWNGEQQFKITSLHPLYIDCARRIRKGDDGWQQTGTSGTRVSGVANGQTGDPWAPVNEAENKVLNPQRSHFQYRRLAQILFGGEYRRPISFSDTTEGFVVCRAITPSETNREFHLQRIIPFSNASAEGFFEEDSAVAKEAERRVDRAGDAAGILANALYLLLRDDDAHEQNRGEEQQRVADLSERQRQLDAFHSRIDDQFFDRLFDAGSMSDEERYIFWDEVLLDALKTQLEEALDLCPSKDQWKRLARTRSIAWARMRETLPYAFHDTNESNDDGERHDVSSDTPESNRAV